MPSSPVGRAPQPRVALFSSLAFAATSQPSSAGKKSHTALIAGCVVGGVVALVMVAILAWFLRRRSVRARDAAEGRGKTADSVGELTVVASRPESPERKFAKIEEGALGYPSPHLTVQHLPLPKEVERGPTGISSQMFAGRPVSKAGVIGNANSGAYAPKNTRYPVR